MCDIMAGMDEKDSQTTVSGFAGDFSRRAVLSSLLAGP